MTHCNNVLPSTYAWGSCTPPSWPHVEYPLSRRFPLTGSSVRAFLKPHYCSSQCLSNGLNNIQNRKSTTHGDRKAPSSITVIKSVWIVLTETTQRDKKKRHKNCTFQSRCFLSSPAMFLRVQLYQQSPTSSGSPWGSHIDVPGADGTGGSPSYQTETSKLKLRFTNSCRPNSSKTCIVMPRSSNICLLVLILLPLSNIKNSYNILEN